MPPYNEIDSIISDYYILKSQFKPNSAVLNAFPKMLLMSIASLYEVRVTTQLSQIVSGVDSGAITTLPRISSLHNYKRTSEYLYSRFFTFNKSLQIEEFDAQPFYDLMGGHTFLTTLKTNFNAKRASKQTALEKEIDILLQLANENSDYEEKWIGKVDEKDKLTVLNFEESEHSFLGIKRRRNCLAHDYINGFSDTFQDIELLYRKSYIYVDTLFEGLMNII